LHAWSQGSRILRPSLGFMILASRLPSCIPVCSVPATQPLATAMHCSAAESGIQAFRHVQGPEAHRCGLSHGACLKLHNALSLRSTPLQAFNSAPLPSLRVSLRVHDRGSKEETSLCSSLLSCTVPSPGTSNLQSKTNPTSCLPEGQTRSYSEYNRYTPKHAYGWIPCFTLSFVANCRQGAGVCPSPMAVTASQESSSYIDLLHQTARYRVQSDGSCLDLRRM